MRTRIMLCFLLGFVLAIPVSLAAESETHYFVLLMDGQKIGYAENTRVVKGDRVINAEKTVMTLSRGAVNLTSEKVDEQVETRSGKPISFKVVSKENGVVQTVEGVVKGGKVTVARTVGGVTETQTIDWPKGALLSEGADLLTKKMGLKEGTTYTIKAFDPESLMVMEVEVRVGPRKEVDLLGRVVMLTEVRGTMSMGGPGKINMVLYSDDKFNMKKVVTSLMGMKMEAVSCSKEVALSKNDVVHFFDKTVVRCPVPLEGYESAKSITYTLEATDGEELKIMTCDSQAVRKGDGGTLIVTVTPIAASKGEMFPYKGGDKDALENLKSNRYLQCDRKEIKDLAKAAVGETKDAAEAAKTLEGFVRSYITKKDLSVGYATAVEVAASKLGDCTEHAVLLAAMCRAVGIPAKVAVGVSYAPEYEGETDIFVPHAWVKALIGGKWVDLDAAAGVDAGHIVLAVGDGDMVGFFDMLNTLGRFRVVKAEVEKE